MQISVQKSLPANGPAPVCMWDASKLLQYTNKGSRYHCQASSLEMARHLWLWLKFWVFRVGLQINKSIGLKLIHNWVGFKGVLAILGGRWRVFWECIFSLCPATVLCLCSAEIGDAKWVLWKVFQNARCLCCLLIAINNLPCHSSLLCVFHLQFCIVESCFFCTQM